MFLKDRSADSLKVIRRCLVKSQFDPRTVFVLVCSAPFSLAKDARGKVLATNGEKRVEEQELGASGDERVRLGAKQAVMGAEGEGGKRESTWPQENLCHQEAVNLLGISGVPPGHLLLSLSTTPFFLRLSV